MKTLKNFAIPLLVVVYPLLVDAASRDERGWPKSARKVPVVWQIRHDGFGFITFNTSTYGEFLTKNPNISHEIVPLKDPRYGGCIDFLKNTETLSTACFAWTTLGRNGIPVPKEQKFPPPNDDILKLRFEYGRIYSDRYKTATGAHVGMTAAQLVKVYKAYGRPYVWDIPTYYSIDGKPEDEALAEICFKQRISGKESESERPGVHNLKFVLKPSPGKQKVAGYTPGEIERPSRFLADPQAKVISIYYDDCRETLN